MTGFTDIHAHFVYGLDDGAQTKENMQTMLDTAWKDGVTTLFATPHMTPGLRPFDEESFDRRLCEAREYCEQKQYAMRLYKGAEILFTPAVEYYIRDHKLITLADTGSVLVEFSPMLSYEEIRDALELLQRSGYFPVVAHVERYRFLQGRGIYDLKEETGAEYQMNCRSYLKDVGFFQNRRIVKYLRDELIDYFATDSHDTGVRKSCLHDAYEKLQRDFDGDYAKRLTQPQFA